MSIEYAAIARPYQPEEVVVIRPSWSHIQSTHLRIWFPDIATCSGNWNWSKTTITKSVLSKVQLPQPFLLIPPTYRNCSMLPKSLQEENEISALHNIHPPKQEQPTIRYIIEQKKHTKPLAYLQYQTALNPAMPLHRNTVGLLPPALHFPGLGRCPTTPARDEQPWPRLRPRAEVASNSSNHPLPLHDRITISHYTSICSMHTSTNELLHKIV